MFQIEKSAPAITEEQRDPDADGSRSICDPSRGATLINKVPAWDDRHQCWALDFKGRATRASIHNFQLISATNSVLSREGAADPAAESVILQLGKVGKGVYILDFCAPLSPLQAFSICLSSFATGAGLEPWPKFPLNLCNFNLKFIFQEPGTKFTDFLVGADE